MNEQFRGVFNAIFRGRVTADISNAATGSGTFGSATVTVPGVQLGDLVFVSPVTTAMTAGAPVVGEVSAANTVRLVILNNSAGAVDQASQSYNLVVLRPQVGA